MDISVEISTFNNKGVLRQVLERLARQTCPEGTFEVVLSDDGSSDGLLEMVEQLSPRLPYPVRLLRHEHQGAAAAHNAGIRVCSADLVIMLAADILAVPELVEAHLRAHRDHPQEHAVVVGRLRQSPQLPPTIVQKSWDLLVDRLFAQEKTDLKHGGFLVSNISFKKTFMLRHGGFKLWPPAAQEDIELGHRLAQNGMQLISCPVALGFHHHAATLAGIANRAYAEGYNWHIPETALNALWLRRRSGHVRPHDGIVAYTKCLIKRSLHSVLLSRFTVEKCLVPLIRNADRWRLLVPLVPLLIGKVAAYYFRRGLHDYEHERPWATIAI